jgi:hypothetical protein
MHRPYPQKSDRPSISKKAIAPVPEKAIAHIPEKAIAHLFPKRRSPIYFQKSDEFGALHSAATRNNTLPNYQTYLSSIHAIAPTLTTNEIGDRSPVCLKC